MSENIEPNTDVDLVTVTKNLILDRSNPILQARGRAHVTSEAPPQSQVDTGQGHAPVKPPPYSNASGDAKMNSGKSAQYTGNTYTSVRRLTYMEPAQDFHRANHKQQDYVVPEPDHYDYIPTGSAPSAPTTPNDSYYRTLQLPETRISKQSKRRQYGLAALAVAGLLSVYLASALAGIVLIGQQIENRMDGSLSVIQTNISDSLNKTWDSTEALITDIRLDSPDLLVKYKNNCYCVYTNKLTWYEARSFCIGLGKGVNLVEITDLTVNEYLNSFLVALSNGTQSVWLGASDHVTAGTFMWNTSHVPVEVSTPNLWKDGRPGTDIGENCVKNHAYKPRSYQWNNAGCNLKLWYMCQSLEEERRCRC